MEQPEGFTPKSNKKCNFVIFYSDDFLKHDTKGDAENEKRLIAITNLLLADKEIEKGVEWRLPILKDESEIAQLITKLGVHSIKYLKSVKDVCDRGGGKLDKDTVVGPHSYRVSLLAVQAWLDAVDEVTKPGGKCCFALARPPGHHAAFENSRGMCIFGNAAIAAMYALHFEKAKKVAILDWDIHHGDGTQAAVHKKPGIWFCSMHQSRFWEGRQKIQMPNGLLDNVLNVAIEPGEGLATYLKCFTEKVIPYFEQVKPDILIVSSGYDCLEHDRLGNMKLQPEDFEQFTKCCLKICKKVVFGLEGGYNLERLPKAILSTITPFLRK